MHTYDNEYNYALSAYSFKKHLSWSKIIDATFKQIYEF